ncbi:MAG: hypothetical protein LBH85_06410 [Treponema sp.]|jgi:hypothetical protein|nr:hypothetical protein [Treponema sp.]
MDKKITQDDRQENEISNKCAKIINNSFTANKFNQQEYELMYNRILCPEKEKKFFWGVNYCGVSILTNNLAENIEPVFF